MRKLTPDQVGQIQERTYVDAALALKLEERNPEPACTIRGDRIPRCIAATGSGHLEMSRSTHRDQSTVEEGKVLTRDRGRREKSGVNLAQPSFVFVQATNFPVLEFLQSLTRGP